MQTAICPGSFDPVTLGHLDVINRAAKLFEQVVVCVVANANKNTLFTLEERCDHVRRVTAHLPNVRVDTWDGLLVDYADKFENPVVVRGLRAVSDFEYEFQLALMNRRLRREIQTVFLMTDYQWLYISSTIVKAAASHGGDVEGLVPDNVLRCLREKYDHGEVRQGTPCLAPSVGGFRVF